MRCEAYSRCSSPLVPPLHEVERGSGGEAGASRQGRLVRSIVNAMSRTVPLRIALLLVAAAAGACGRQPSGGPPRVAVTVARAERRAVPYQLGATGTVEPIRAVASCRAWKARCCAC